MHSDTQPAMHSGAPMHSESVHVCVHDHEILICEFLLQDYNMTNFELTLQNKINNLLLLELLSEETTLVLHAASDNNWVVSKLAELKCLFLKANIPSASSFTKVNLITTQKNNNFETGSKLLYETISLLLNTHLNDSRIDALLHLSSLPLVQLEILSRFSYESDYTNILQLFDAVHDVHVKLLDKEKVRMKSNNMSSSKDFQINEQLITLSI
jgi:hypothetical protein